ncbi:MAG: site-specific integrase [Planctomycetota bacterium]
MPRPAGSPALRVVEDGRRRTTRFVFTKARVAAVPPPARGSVLAYDTRAPGLAVRVTSTGRRAFYIYKKVNGRPRKLKLGGTDAISIEQARNLTARHLAAMAEGDDPAEVRREARREMTVGEVRETYHENHAKARCSETTVTSETSLWNTSLATLATRRMSAVTTGDVAGLHARLGRDKGHRTANRAVSYLGRLYRYAERHHDYKGDNPTRFIDPFPEQSRERFLSADELAAFLDAIDHEPAPFPDLFRAMLFTGARSANVRMMKWTDLDLKRAVWTVPAGEAKAGHEMAVPLVEPMVEMLSRRMEAQAGRQSVYVFPAERSISKPYVSQPHRPFARACKRAKIKNLRIHDLRRTMGAMQAIGGAGLPIIGRSLGHRDARATAVYARLSDDPVRESMSKAVAAMLKPRGDTD